MISDVRDIKCKGNDCATGVTILVAAENVGLNHLTQKVLWKSRFNTKGVYNGRDAVANAIKVPGTILLMNCTHPDMTGREIIEILDGYGCNVPFIVMTERGDSRIAVEMMRLGARNCIVKKEGFVDILPVVLRRVCEEQAKEQRLIEMENALRRYEEMYRTIVETSPDAVTVTDLKGRITFASRRTLEMHGFEAIGELLGRNAFDLIAPEDRDRAMKNLQKTLDEGIVRDVEYRLLGKDGSGFTGELSAALVKDHAGTPVAFVATTRDITDRKFLEVQLVQAQKLESIGRLAAGIAHEINTPIQYIGDNVHFLKEAFGTLIEGIEICSTPRESDESGPRESDRAEKAKDTNREAEVEYLTGEIPAAIEQSLEGVAQVAKIVRAMKEFSHPGTVEKTSIDINRAIESTITVSRNEWKYVAEMITDLDPGLPLVPCLPGDFKQVILNLIINAAHSVAEAADERKNGKGTIEISTRSGGEGIEIRISDTGAGIPEAIQHNIFDPFFTTKEIGKGTGQGLAIARSVIVEKHGGTIAFETETGRGTEFIIRLPVTAMEVKDNQ